MSKDVREILVDLKVDKYKMPKGLVAYYSTDIDQALSSLAELIRSMKMDYKSLEYRPDEADDVEYFCNSYNQAIEKIANMFKEE